LIIISPLNAGFLCSKTLPQQEHEGADISQFLISIPQREIVHANLHNFDYKNHFSDARYDRIQTTPDESN
jgi:hypothetical protein